MDFLLPHARVRRGTALENAVSVASMLLLTEATLTEIPAPKTEAQPVGDLG
jgi:chaperonin GroEL